MQPTANGKKEKKRKPAILLPVTPEFRARLKKLARCLGLPATEFIRRAVNHCHGEIVDLLRQRVEADARAFVVRQAKEFFRTKRKNQMPWSELRKRARHEEFVTHVHEAVAKTDVVGLLDRAHEAGKAFSIAKPKPDDWGKVEIHDFTGDSNFATAILGLTGLGECEDREGREPKWRSDLKSLNLRMADHWRSEAVLRARELGLPQLDGNSPRPRAHMMQLKGTIDGKKYEIGAPNPLNPGRSIVLGPRHLQALNVLLSFVDPRRLEEGFVIRLEAFTQRFPEPDGVQLLGDLFDGWVKLVASDAFTITSNFGERGAVGRVGRRRLSLKFSWTTAHILRSVV